MHTPSSQTIGVKDSAGIEAQLETILRRLPPMLRLPKPKERCPHTGQSRTSLVELIAPCERNQFKPPVAATYLKKNERARRGTWLIHSESLFRYLLSQSERSLESHAAMRRERQESRQS